VRVGVSGSGRTVDILRAGVARRGHSSRPALDAEHRRQNRVQTIDASARQRPGLSRPPHRSSQYRIKVGAIDAAALGPFKNRPTATDEKSSLLCSGLIYLFGTLSGKSLKLLPPDVIF